MITRLAPRRIHVVMSCTFSTCSTLTYRKNLEMAIEPLYTVPRGTQSIEET
jgi:hypothetical protein